MQVPLDAPIIPNGHFRWDEYCFLHGFGKYAEPTPEEYKNAIFLFTHLEPLRVELGKPMAVRSGARTKAYTAYLQSEGIPAAPNSAHNEWRAVDIDVPNMRTADLWRFCRDRWPGRLEELAATPTWVHLDTWQWGQKITFRP